MQPKSACTLEIMYSKHILSKTRNAPKPSQKHKMHRYITRICNARVSKFQRIAHMQQKQPEQAHMHSSKISRQVSMPSSPTTIKSSSNQKLPNMHREGINSISFSSSPPPHHRAPRLRPHTAQPAPQTNSSDPSPPENYHSAARP